MPVKIRKVKKGYQVKTDGIKAKGTTKKKATAQARLLRAIEHNPSFKPRKRKK